MNQSIYTVRLGGWDVVAVVLGIGAMLALKGVLHLPRDLAIMADGPKLVLRVWGRADEIGTLNLRATDGFASGKLV